VDFVVVIGVVVVVVVVVDVGQPIKQNVFIMIDASIS